MALYRPTYLENYADHNAVQPRTMIGSLVSGGVDAPGALAVTEAPGTPDMSVRVAGGGVFIPSTRSVDQGTYHAYNDGAVTVVVPAADATNPRIDLVCVRVRDEALDVTLTQNDVVFELVQGTAASVPSAPSVPFEDYLILAEIDVGAGVTAIEDGDITDRREASSVWSDGRSEVAYAEDASGTGGFTTGETNVLAITFTAEEGRVYAVEAMIKLQSTANDTVVALRCKDNVTGRAPRHDVVLPLSGRSVTQPLWDRRGTYAPGSVTITYTAERQTASGTITAVASGGSPMPIRIVDVGGVLT